MPILPSPCLMILTDRTQLSPNWTLAQAIAPAITGGASFVLFREVDLPPGPRSTVFGFVADGVRGRVPLVVQGTPGWSRSVGADGVHLEQSDVSVADARNALGPEAWVGLTAVSREQARGAEGADYVLIHTDWNDPPSALAVIGEFAAVSSAPLVVGPDVPLERVSACLSAGAAGVAVMSAAMAAYDRTGAARSYVVALGDCPHNLPGRMPQGVRNR